METIAKHRHARSSAQKVRLVANQIRGLAAEQALDILKFSKKKAAYLIRKVLLSAIANAENNNGITIDELWVTKIFIDEATRIKRMHARAKGRGNRIVKPTCHICIVVSSEKRKK